MKKLFFKNNKNSKRTPPALNVSLIKMKNRQFNTKKNQKNQVK